MLAAHDESSGAARVAAARQRARVERPSGADRDGARRSAATAHITAVHMTWGAINEWTTQAGYAPADPDAATIRCSPTLLRRIMKQEGRHIDFYASQATPGSSGSRAAQRLTRFALRRRWAPVGSGRDAATPRCDTSSTYLFGDAAGREAVARIDRRIDRLPGLGRAASSSPTARRDRRVDRVERLSSVARSA